MRYHRKYSQTRANGIGLQPITLRNNTNHISIIKLKKHDRSIAHSRPDDALIEAIKKNGGGHRILSVPNSHMTTAGQYELTLNYNIYILRKIKDKRSYANSNSIKNSPLKLLKIHIINHK